MSNSVIPWTVVYQVPRSMKFSRQEYWWGLPFPSPGDLLYPVTKPRSPALQADALWSEPPGEPLVAGVTMNTLSDEVTYNFDQYFEWEPLDLLSLP